MTMSNNVSIEKFYEAQEGVLNDLKAKKDVLEKIKKAEYPLIVKWQMMISVLLPLQFEYIKKLGFTNDQTALMDFNAQLMEYQKTDQKLKDLNDAKWNFLFEQAFGITKVDKISQDQAIALVTDISNEIMSERFLQQVDQFMTTLDPKLTLIEKRQSLLSLLMPMQLHIMSQHGFEGEQGYVQAQKALIEYLHNPQMIEVATKAQMTLFKRAGLLEQ
jgi:hypothetical protein